MKNPHRRHVWIVVKFDLTMHPFLLLNVTAITLQGDAHLNVGSELYITTKPQPLSIS